MSVKVYFTNDGNDLQVQRGGRIYLEQGSKMVPHSGVQASAIADVPTAGEASAAANAAAINSILAALRALNIIASS